MKRVEFSEVGEGQQFYFMVPNVYFNNGKSDLTFCGTKMSVEDGEYNILISSAEQLNDEKVYIFPIMNLPEHYPVFIKNDENS